MKEKQKVNLKILHALVKELETLLDQADALAETEAEPHLYTVEMSKAMGVASGIMAEAGLLIGDIQVLSSNQSLKATGLSKTDLLDKLMGTVKPKGSN
jgi:hypothetical protein